jgi:hypothetical protein
MGTIPKGSGSAYALLPSTPTSSPLPLELQLAMSAAIKIKITNRLIALRLIDANKPSL